MKVSERQSNVYTQTGKVNTFVVSKHTHTCISNIIVICNNYISEIHTCTCIAHHKYNTGYLCDSEICAFWPKMAICEFY